MVRDSQLLRFGLVAFLGGFNVMLIEMCAFRVLQTHFGSSVFVTGILLTVVLLSMTWGSYLGGNWKRLHSEDAAVAAIFVSVAYLVVVNLVFRERIIDGLTIWKAGYVRFAYPTAVALILYAVPILVLSLLFPVFVQRSGDMPGPLAGKLVALGNLGSIFGVLLATFVFLPFAGLQWTTSISAVTLLLCCWALCRRPLYPRLALATVAILALVAFGQYRRTPLPPNVVERGQSLYGEYTVQINKRGGVPRAVAYSSSRIYVHSAYRFGGLSRNRYELDALSYGALNDKKRFLLLGSGAGGILRVFSELGLKDASILGVELDPDALRIARQWFGVLEGPAVRMLDGDARAFLAAAAPGSFDFVMIDVFSGESLPVHCLTREFFQLLSSRMAPDGVLYFNTNLPQHSHFESAGFDALGHVVATLRATGFDAVYFNNQQDQGFLYVFKQPVEAPELLERMQRYAASREHPEALRLGVLANSFSIQEAPGNWATLAPFTDDLTPEPLMYSYFIADWRSRVAEAAVSRMAGESALGAALARFARPRTQAYAVDYARAVLAWTEANPAAGVRQILASALCREISQELLELGKDHRGPATVRLLSYLRGMDRELAAPEALRALQEAM